MEGVGRNPGSRRYRKPSRRPSTGTKRAGKASKAAEEEVRTAVEPWLRDQRKSLTTRFSPTSSRSGGMLGVDPPQSLDQVADPSWLTAAVGASAPVSESFRSRESAGRDQDAEPASLRAERDRRGTTSSPRIGRLLPRASLVREAKRLFDAGSIDQGRCPLCGQTMDHKNLARRIESALVEVMEASRDLRALPRSGRSADR